MPGVSVVYITHREEPRFDWFADSLAATAGDADLEVILVDGLHAPSRTARFATAVAGRFPFRHAPAKPCPCLGPYRLTRRDYFAPASARNTGVVLATRPYVAFVDDASVLMSGWWRAVRDAAGDEQVVAGAYQKRWEMVVQRGVLLRSRLEPSGVDSRWSAGSDTRGVAVSGSWLFGCSLGMPRGLLLAVNGFDELCNIVGMEDCQLGLRIERLGVRIHYTRRMLTVESEELHRQAPGPLRVDKATDPATYLRRLRGFGLSRRAVEGPFDSSHMLLDLLHGTPQVQALGNYYHLRILHERNLDQTRHHFPRTHWFDGQPLASM